MEILYENLLLMDWRYLIMWAIGGLLIYLAIAKDILAEKGITLKIVEFTDYVQPNNVVDSGEIDANYFQHVPYLDDFNAQNGTDIVSVGAIHVEPMGIYGGKQSSLDAIK